MDRDDRDDLILAERLTGKSVRAIAKRHGCSSTEVEAAVDRQLDYELDNRMRLKAIKLDCRRLEALMEPFFERAVRDKDVAAGTLCCKLLERRSLLLGLDSPTRIDIVQLHAEQEVSSFDKAFEIVTRLARGSGKRPEDGNGAVGALSGSGS